MSIKNQISVVIIANNAEKHLDQCIKSALNISDDVIVCDSGSTDNTLNIIKQNDVKLIQNEWLGFSNTKNYCNQFAKYEYIFSLDSDEVISDALIKSIHAEIKIGLNGMYNMNRKNWYCTAWLKYGGWYPDNKIRLFNKHNSSWEGDVHEYIISRFPNNSKFIKGDILHYTIHSKQEHIDKVKKYAKIWAEKTHKQGKKIPLFVGYLKSIFEFIKIYFYKLAILEGSKGLQLSLIQAYDKFLRILYLKKLNQH